MLQTKSTRLEKKHIGTYKNDLSKARNEKLKAVNTVQDKAIVNQKQLKIKIAQLREELKDNNSERSDYAKLEQLTKELKIQVKEKTLNINSLENQLENLRESLTVKNQEIEELKEKLIKRDIEIEEVTDIAIENYNKKSEVLLATDNKLSEAQETIFNQNAIINTLKQDKADLKRSIDDLKLTYDELNTCLIKIGSVVYYDGDETKELIKSVQKIKEERDSLMNIINRAIEWVQNDVPSLIREFIYSFSSEFKRDEKLKDYDNSNNYTIHKNRLK
jgi:chromosome segregation ATPase